MQVINSGAVERQLQEPFVKCCVCQMNEGRIYLFNCCGRPLHSDCWSAAYYMNKEEDNKYCSLCLNKKAGMENTQYHTPSWDRVQQQICKKREEQARIQEERLEAQQKEEQENNKLGPFRPLNDEEVAKIEDVIDDQHLKKINPLGFAYEFLELSSTVKLCFNLPLRNTVSKLLRDYHPHTFKEDFVQESLYLQFGEKAVILNKEYFAKRLRHIKWKPTEEELQRLLDAQALARKEDDKNDVTVSDAPDQDQDNEQQKIKQSDNIDEANEQEEIIDYRAWVQEQHERLERHTKRIFKVQCAHRDLELDVDDLLKDVSVLKANGAPEEPNKELSVSIPIEDFKIMQKEVCAMRETMAKADVYNKKLRAKVKQLIAAQNNTAKQIKQLKVSAWASNDCGKKRALKYCCKKIKVFTPIFEEWSIKRDLEIQAQKDLAQAQKDLANKRFKEVQDGKQWRKDRMEWLYSEGGDALEVLDRKLQREHHERYLSDCREHHERTSGTKTSSAVPVKPKAFGRRTLTYQSTLKIEKGQAIIVKLSKTNKPADAPAK